MLKKALNVLKAQNVSEPHTLGEGMAAYIEKINKECKKLETFLTDLGNEASTKYREDPMRISVSSDALRLFAESFTPVEDLMSLINSMGNQSTKKHLSTKMCANPMDLGDLHFSDENPWEGDKVFWKAGDGLRIEKHSSPPGHGLSYPSFTGVAIEDGFSGGWDVFDMIPDDSALADEDGIVSVYGFSVEQAL